MNLDEERHPPKQVTWFDRRRQDDGLRPKDIEVSDEQTPDAGPRSTRPTTTSASAKAWSISPS